MLHFETHESQQQMLDMRIKVIRVDVHAFHHDQQLSELKRLAAEDPRPVSEIYDELVSNITTNLDTAAYFPSCDQARNTMYYSRTKRYPRLPARRQDRPLTAEQTTTKSGAQFLMYDSPTNDILIFATKAGVRLLAQSNCWCGDETILIVPSWYQQLFTLHVFMRGKLLPVVYCLTVRKDLSTYSRIFEVVYFKAEVELGVQLDPAKFVCDFETALITAIQSNFPNTRLQGCFFHFCQAVVLQVAFLPVNLLPAAFEILNVGALVELEALFDFFQREWLPATKIPLWNVRGVVVRTNNHLDDWQNRMNKRARYTRGSGSVRRSAAYGVQPRRVVALTGRLRRSKISIERILCAISYHTLAPLQL
ncbi:hypothetical protein T4D_14597 [Trichinella pseudospiralis]|uniref:MULE transposase domain-containing protein n=1 Tax=Trichinella pseudospiralis TaxID=6337 RepID=A0A0V1F4Z6_TRIPS|nr:hypothetical protein T4D_14597 [Trichinella pseudospiralis]